MHRNRALQALKGLETEPFGPRNDQLNLGEDLPHQLFERREVRAAEDEIVHPGGAVAPQRARHMSELDEIDVSKQSMLLTHTHIYKQMHYMIVLDAKPQVMPL